MNPNSTLTSSSSTNHLRRALQALPYLPNEEETRPKRGKVEHFVPAIWIPDGKTDSCMRCGRTFGWRRRRHHCRLCGRCVCAGCSGKVSPLCIYLRFMNVELIIACDIFRRSSYMIPTRRILTNRQGLAKHAMTPFSLSLIPQLYQRKVQERYHT